MATEAEDLRPRTQLSIGIFAWNEERAIAGTLNSLLQQSLFVDLPRRNQAVELIVVANGCTDRTAETAERALQRYRESHPARDMLESRVENLSARGKNNAWNQYVHRLSKREAGLLVMMDADILFHRQGTLASLVRTLEEDAEAHVAVDRPCKDVLFKSRKTWRDRLSLAAARTTQEAEGQLCGQLYCIRSQIARNIYLPRDLAACEDGFIKTLVCTDFLSRPAQVKRIRLAEKAEHTFEAYTSPRAILKNQKRQIIGQTIVHILADKILNDFSASDRAHMAAVLEAKDLADPTWLKREISEHLRQVRFCWRLHPGLLAQRFKRLQNLGLAERARCFPSALAGFFAELAASYMACQTLRAGCTDYWPRAERRGFAPAREAYRDRAEQRSDPPPTSALVGTPAPGHRSN